MEVNGKLGKGSCDPVTDSVLTDWPKKVSHCGIVSRIITCVKACSLQPGPHKYQT